MQPAIPSTLRLLPLPCPPMLAEAVGYQGTSRFVAFAWSPAGDEPIYDDGYSSGTGEWTAYLAFVRHPVVRPLLADVQLGSSDREASHWLLADLADGRLYLGPRHRARRRSAWRICSRICARASSPSASRRWRRTRPRCAGRWPRGWRARIAWSRA